MNLVAKPTGRRVVFAALYLSEGAPVGLIWWALPTVLRAGDEAIARITQFTALLVLPWALKFIWAPLVDTLRGRWWGYRCWILAAQLVMGLTILPLAWLDVGEHLNVILMLLLAHALAAATQDVAIDAWAIRITPKHEHAGLTGSMQVGYLSGRWLFGAGLLLVWDHLSQGLIFALLIATIWCSAILVALSGPGDAAGSAENGDEQSPTISGRLRAFGTTLRAAFSTQRTWLGIVLALVGGAAFEAVGVVAGPFLIDQGLSKTAVGAFYTANIAAMLPGALVVAFVADRIGHRRSVIASLLYLAMVIVVLAAVASIEDGGEARRWSLLGLLVAVYFGIGVYVAASYALFMDLTDPKIGGTQFSTFMGATNACESWAGYSVGKYIAAWGYPIAFLIMAGLSLFALPVLWMLERFQDQSD